MFAVIRHPEVAALGTCPEEALEHYRGLGWQRVSEWRADPTDFHLPGFADATADLDATVEAAGPEPAPEPETKPAKTTKEKAA